MDWSDGPIEGPERLGSTMRSTPAHAGRAGEAATGEHWVEATRRRARSERLTYWSMLGATVLAPVLAAVLLEVRSQVFLLKAVAILLLAGLPGWLYLEFVRSKGYSLYDEYVINLFRLQIDQYCNLPAPPRHTSWYTLWTTHHRRLETPGRDNLYRRKFEAVFGAHAVSTRALLLELAAEDGRMPRETSTPKLLARYGSKLGRRSRTETFRPVLLATLLLSIGWTVVINPELYRSISLMGPFPFSGRPELPVEALRFGFVGAYWFILQDVVRRYFRDDLKTSAYVSVSTRIIVVVVLVATMTLVPVEPQEQALLAFLVGVFPQLGIQVLKNGAGRLGKRMLANLEIRYPLSDLDGLSVWDEARLAEEGIEDLQGLTTANLVDVLLRTRVPIARLVDWLDQAFLYLRLPAGDDGAAARRRLRSLGIRGATDLERVWPAPGEDEELRRGIAATLGGASSVAVESLLRAFAGDVNLVHVRAFRNHSWLSEAFAPGDSSVDLQVPGKAA
jgi:hypothetical protein